MARKTKDETLAAIDLGSNSFHMVVARLVQGEIHIVNRLKESVRLAAGINAEGDLREDAQERALACLERFGQILRDVDPTSIRAVGTNTLRQARNRRGFLAAARKALGARISVISGVEEARLIYVGVAHTIAEEGARRLVVDIGGGSTECIIGEDEEPIEASSLYMGCVTWSMRFFNSAKFTDKRFAKAVLAARQELDPIVQRYRNLGWQRAIGTSGTILTVANVLRAREWSKDGITPEGLDALRRELLERKRFDRIAELDEVKTDRAAVLPGGLAILTALFEGLGIERLSVSHGALRRGLLYDQIGRIRDHDRRDVTIERMLERYAVDREQAARVEATAKRLIEQSLDYWELNARWARRFMSWAARVHEIGLGVAYAGHQKHGAYLLRNSDMPGFSWDDQEILATLVITQRRKISLSAFESFGSNRRRYLLRLSILLRLAVVLHRSRSPRPLPEWDLNIENETILLAFPPDWLDDHPLTRADLEGEAKALGRIGYRLVVT